MRRFIHAVVVLSSCRITIQNVFFPDIANASYVYHYPVAILYLVAYFRVPYFDHQSELLVVALIEAVMPAPSS
jgi:hypothetical protein